MSESKQLANKITHDLVLHSREKLNICGVKEIISFDESSVNLKTVNGDLSVDGENIHITVLNVEKGDVELIGKINALTYYDSLEYEKSSIFSRLFK